MSVSLLQVPAMALANGGGGAGPGPDPGTNNMNYKGLWAAGTLYAEENVVLGSNGSQYIALVGSTGVDPVTDIASGQSSTNWARLAADSVVSTWSGTVQYGVGDLVINPSTDGVPTLWQCVAPTLGTVPVPGNANYRLIADAAGASMNYLGAWSGTDAATHTYALNDVVSYLDVAWVSLENNNFNNQPSFTTNVHWQPLGGPGSNNVVHTKTTPPAAGGFALTANAGTGAASTVLTLPASAQNGEFGTFSINFSGLGYTIGATGLTTGINFFISDTLNGVNSGAAVLSTTAFLPLVAAAGTTGLYNATFSFTLQYAYNTSPANLYLNFQIPGVGTMAAYGGAASTYYSYANFSTAAQIITDP